jgi:hypothetical protein
MGNNAPPPTTAARRRALRAAGAVLVLACVLPLIGACVKANPPTDVGSPVSPSTTTTGGGGTTTLPSPTGPLSYNQDMKPIFDSDCVPCHNNSFAAGRYSMSSYSAVLRDVVPGSASSRLVTTTQPGGSMYPYFTSDRATKAALVRAWVVDNKAAQTR